LRRENKVTISRKKWVSVMLAGIFLAVALVAMGITRATAQDNPNSQPSTSEYAADKSGGAFQAAAVPKKVLWAVVNSDGTLARGKGALDASTLGGGSYEVLFDRNVRKCAYTATIGLSGAAGSEVPGEITVVGRAGANNGVFITTHDSTGAFADRGFHLTLNCPA
jgi:hypothetical protein